MMEMDVETVVREPVSPHALRASALRQARWLMAFYGITPEELVARVPAQMAAVDSGVPRALPVKYRHPVTGDTWDGEGSHPQWLRRALLQDGYRVAELRVDGHGDAGASSGVVSPIV